MMKLPQYRHQFLSLEIRNLRFAKNLLMEDLETIGKVIGYITSNVEHLQVASVFCITNLMRSTGSSTEIADRQAKLRELGAEKQLQTLLTTPLPMFE